MEKLSKNEMKAVRGGYTGYGFTCTWAPYEQNTGTTPICTNYWSTRTMVINNCTDDQDRHNFTDCVSTGSCSTLIPCP